MAKACKRCDKIEAATDVVTGKISLRSTETRAKPLLQEFLKSVQPVKEIRTLIGRRIKDSARLRLRRPKCAHTTGNH